MNGAREVQEKVLSKIDNAKLTPIFVWLPRYPGDSRDRAMKAKQLVTDARSFLFWDGKGDLGRCYGRVIDLPNKRKFAWDMYLVFDKQAKWKDEPPRPSFWMHQLGDDARRLDGAKLKQRIERLLASRDTPD